MQKDIHPNYHEIELILTNGEKIKTRSTMAKEGAQVKLDVDPRSHPMWLGKGDNYVNKKVSEIAKFEAKFAGLNFAVGSNNNNKKEEEKKDEA